MSSRGDLQGVSPVSGVMTDPEQYWNRAGQVGYEEAMYSSSKVAVHVKTGMRRIILEAAQSVGLGQDSSVLELGCGDGDLAIQFLSKHFKTVDAVDLAPAGIERANQHRPPNATFICSDITTMPFDEGQKWDAVFMIGILHHVKAATPTIIERLTKVTNKLIVLEPNGNHLGRKFLETLPSYKRAGEDSFRVNEFVNIFSKNAFQVKYFKRFNLFPNFTPDGFYPFIRRFEPWIENSKVLNFLCTCQVFAFEKDSTLA
jgi:SAM-dependent methyltransferase